MKGKIVLTILGSDNFRNYSFLEEEVYKILGPYLEKENIEVIIKEREVNSTDNFCVRFCNENGFTLQRVKVKWNEFGKQAFWINIKELVFGDFESIYPTDILVCFLSENDNEKDVYMIEQVLEEFSSCITDTNGNPADPEYYIFVD